MGVRMKKKSLIFGLLLLSGAMGAAFEASQCRQIERVNQAIQTGQLVRDEAYPELMKFAAAYDQGERQECKHAVQTYGQLLEMNPAPEMQAAIQFNIGNNLLRAGLMRRVNDDGSLQDEARYAFAQARLAYEQSLRLAPDSRRAKFNLTLLYSVLPQNMKGGQLLKTGMELSNLPIGLP